MLGAADELTEQGIYVDAAVSRQMQTVIPEVEELRDAGRLPQTMVVHLGTNGILGDDTMTEFFTALSERPEGRRADGPGAGQELDRPPTTPRSSPCRRSSRTCRCSTGTASPHQCPGNCFYDDGIHLRQDGQDYYTAADRQPARAELTSAGDLSGRGGGPAIRSVA